MEIDLLANMMNRIKRICVDCDTTNSNEVDSCLCDIIDICNEVI